MMRIVREHCFSSLQASSGVIGDGLGFRGFRVWALGFIGLGFRGLGFGAWVPKP